MDCILCATAIQCLFLSCALICSILAFSLYCGVQWLFLLFQWHAQSCFAYGVERNHLREVVFIAILFLQRCVYIGLRTIIICVVFGVERVPPSCLRGVILCRATCYNNGKHCYECDMNIFCVSKLHVLINS